jgi:hypothetical protein
VPDYFDRVERMKTLDALALYTYRSSTTGEAGHPERVGVMRVTPSYFDVARVAPLLGRAFLEEEGEPDRADKAILSYAYWQERYAGNPGILGTEIRIDDQPFTVVGVMGKDLPPGRARRGAPLASPGLPPAAKSDANRHNNSWQSVGRLRDGATLEQAQAEVDRLNAADVERLPQFKQMVAGGGLPHAGAPAAGRHGPQREGDDVLPLGRDAAHPAGRLRQRRQPDPRAVARPDARHRHPPRAGCRPGGHRQAPARPRACC